VILARESSEGVIDGNLQRLEGTKPVGASSNDSDFVIEALDSTSVPAECGTLKARGFQRFQAALSRLSVLFVIQIDIVITLFFG
jgi:hypothetical protein